METIARKERFVQAAIEKNPIPDKPITLATGTNTVSWTAEVQGKEMKAEYKAKEVGE